jgi:hypothetical protein
MGIYMKTSCVGGWVWGETPRIDIRARGLDIDSDVRSKQVLPLLAHTSHYSHQSGTSAWCTRWRGRLEPQLAWVLLMKVIVQA